jgi:predicted SprT family Zn-dependent metalloprotease
MKNGNIKRKKVLNKIEVIETLNILFKKYEFAKVPFCVNDGLRTYGGKKIQIGLKVLDYTVMTNMTDVVIHEFAHSFDYCKNNGYRRNKQNTKWVFHDKIFYDYLKEILLFAYDDIHSYDWGNEYYGIKKMYQKEFCQITINS